MIPSTASSGRINILKSLKYLYLCLLAALLTGSACAGQDYQLYVNGVLYKAPSVIEKGLPYFPVDILSEATGVRIVSFSNQSVRLAGSPVEFVPAMRKGRPFLPAEAFALASGSGVETDQTRGLVLYSKNPAGVASSQAAPAEATGPARANPGVTANDPGPAPAPVSAPANVVVQSSPNTEGIHESVIGAMKTAQEITYAQRWLKHKMYWANQLDPANSPYLRVNVPAAAMPMYSPHPWATP